jgi:membrane-associated phospholipid phosphatase
MFHLSCKQSTMLLLPVLSISSLLLLAVFGLKDLLESPRPADCLKAAPSSMSITIRDYSGDIEDGLPSAHCSGSVALLFYCVEAAAAAGLISSECKLALQLAAAAWVGWIAFGRLYLAVHSPGKQLGDAPVWF